MVQLVQRPNLFNYFVRFNIHIQCQTSNSKLQFKIRKTIPDTQPDITFLKHVVNSRQQRYCPIGCIHPGINIYRACPKSLFSHHVLAFLLCGLISGRIKYPGETNIRESAKWQLYTVNEKCREKFGKGGKGWDNEVIKLKIYKKM